jgi:hypothetical protein
MRNIIVFLLLFLCSCGTSKNGGKKDKVLGRWCAFSTQADYPHLSFRQDGYVLFDCKIDTFFSLKYSLSNNKLLLMPTNNPISQSRILKLTQDSLILETLLGHKELQVYYRCK